MSAHVSENVVPYMGFSSPHEPVDELLIETLVRGYGAEILRRLAHTRSIYSFDSGLAQILDMAGSEDLAFSVFWDISVGEARKLLLRKQVEPNSRLVNLGLNLLRHGLAGEWKITLPHPSHIRWGDQLLGVGQSVFAKSDGHECTISLTDGTSCVRSEFKRKGRGWQGPEGVPLSKFEINRHKVIVLSPDSSLGVETDIFGSLASGHLWSSFQIDARRPSNSLTTVPRSIYLGSRESSNTLYPSRSLAI